MVWDRAAEMILIAATTGKAADVQQASSRGIFPIARGYGENDAIDAIWTSKMRDQAGCGVSHATCALVAFGIGAGLLAAPLTAVAEQTEKIALAVSITGAGESYGSPSLDGARLAVEEANAAGKAPRIELTVYDDTSNADHARDVARRIVASDALVVVGPAYTLMALAAGPIYAEAGLVCVGTTATGGGITENTTIFRASFSTSDGGEALAN